MAVVFVPSSFDSEERVVMRGVSWEQFETYLDERGDALPRVTYLEGTLELMSPSKDHEIAKKYFAAVVEAYLDTLRIRYQGVGSWLIKQSRVQAGLEPDECYILHAADKARPDLAIEVIWTSGSVDKLEVYRRLDIPEVWFWMKGRVHIYVLGSDGFQERSESACLPNFDFELVREMMRLSSLSEVRDALRERLAASSS